MKRIILLVFLSVPFLASAQTVEKWKIFEVTLNGPSSGNPFVDNYISAVFITTGYSDTIAGFYDGNGKYIVRF